ncbi:hypothetical protein DQ400_01540 [Vreelandella sulfidaeris]|uniref:Uncharacterized protein n=1 Tax=Vreelandella sulfidaeris TaxID=115553 RepID=A0A365TVD6_9GAMM|nr:hypothetical protein DQ400_01540 [Halomonas sulfidaeris]
MDDALKWQNRQKFDRRKRWSAKQSSLTQTLFTYSASQFIFASLLFLAGGVANFYRASRMHH